MVSPAGTALGPDLFHAAMACAGGLGAPVHVGAYA